MSEARRFLRHEIGRYIQYVEIVVVEPYIVADRREIAVSVPRIGEVLLVVRRASAVSECAQIQHILRDIATSCNGQIISLEGGDDESFLLVEYVLSPQSCVGACEETVGEIDRFLSKNKKILLLHSLSLLRCKVFNRLFCIFASSCIGSVDPVSVSVDVPHPFSILGSCIEKFIVTA